MPEKVVLLDATREGVAIVTLNRPAVHNAVNEDMVSALIDIVDELKGADGVRAVILDAAGTSFSSGIDAEGLRFVADYTHDDNLEAARAMRQLLLKWRALPKMTIALVHGATVGLGVGLVAGADVAIADRSAFFSVPDVRLGLSAAVVLPPLIGAIGARAARRWALTGERMEAAEALRLGLVHELVDDRPGLADKSEAIVSAVFQCAPGAIAATKPLISVIEDNPSEPHLTAELARHYADSLDSSEGQEGLAAFLTGRKPTWME